VNGYAARNRTVTHQQRTNDPFTVAARIYELLREFGAGNFLAKCDRQLDCHGQPVEVLLTRDFKDAESTGMRRPLLHVEQLVAALVEMPLVRTAVVELELRSVRSIPQIPTVLPTNSSEEPKKLMPHLKSITFWAEALPSDIHSVWRSRNGKEEKEVHRKQPSVIKTGTVSSSKFLTIISSFQ